MVITTAPDFGGRSFGTSVVEAALLMLGKMGRRNSGRLRARAKEHICARALLRLASDDGAAGSLSAALLRYFISVLASASMGPRIRLLRWDHDCGSRNNGAARAHHPFRDHALHRNGIRGALAGRSNAGSSYSWIRTRSVQPHVGAYGAWLLLLRTSLQRSRRGARR